MVAKWEEAKRKLQDHLQDGKLSFDGLYQYLLWLAQSDLDIFAHLSEKEQAKQYEEDVGRIFSGLMNMIAKGSGKSG
jgi:hypothetical protein